MKLFEAHPFGNITKDILVLFNKQDFNKHDLSYLLLLLYPLLRCGSDALVQSQAHCGTTVTHSGSTTHFYPISLTEVAGSQGYETFGEVFVFNLSIVVLFEAEWISVLD